MVDDVLDYEEFVPDDDDVTPNVPVQPYDRWARTTIPPQHPYQPDFGTQTHKKGSTLLYVPVHHYQVVFTTKTYKKYDEGTALLNVHTSTGYNLNKNYKGF